MKRIWILVALIYAFLVQSCVTADCLKTSDAPGLKLPHSLPAKVEVYSLNDTSKHYIILGKVLVAKDAGSDADDVIRLLQQEASILGADAIVDLRLEYVPGGWSEAIKATGTAVKLPQE